MILKKNADLKILVVGAGGVGKQTFMKAFDPAFSMDEAYRKQHICPSQHMIDDQLCNLTLDKTSSTSDKKRLNAADSYIFVYSIQNRESLEALHSFKEYIWKSKHIFPACVVGTHLDERNRAKSDDSRFVSREEGKKVAKLMHAEHIEWSKLMYGCRQAFTIAGRRAKHIYDGGAEYVRKYAFGFIPWGKRLRFIQPQIPDAPVMEGTGIVMFENQMEELFNSSLFYDLVLCCSDGNDIKAHRCVLSSCNDYFKKRIVMAHKLSQESVTVRTHGGGSLPLNIIKLDMRPDLTSNSVSIAVNWLYSQRRAKARFRDVNVKFLNNIAAAAECFSIKDLAQFCVSSKPLAFQAEQELKPEKKCIEFQYRESRILLPEEAYSILNLSNFEVSEQTANTPAAVPLPIGSVTGHVLRSRCVGISSNNTTLDSNSSSVKNGSNSDNFLKLLESGEFSDVWLYAGEDQYHEPIPVHSAIIAARSQPLRAMLIHDSIEKNSRQIYLQNVDVEAVKAFAKYLYTEDLKVCTNPRIASQLLYLGSMYFLDEDTRLKAYCELVISTNIDPTSVMDALHFAEVTNSTQLREQCFHRIAYDSFENAKNYVYCEQDMTPKEELTIRYTDTLQSDSVTILPPPPPPFMPLVLPSLRRKGKYIEEAHIPMEWFDEGNTPTSPPIPPTLPVRIPTTNYIDTLRIDEGSSSDSILPLPGPPPPPFMPLVLPSLRRKGKHIEEAHIPMEWFDEGNTPTCPPIPPTLPVRIPTTNYIDTLRIDEGSSSESILPLPGPTSKSKQNAEVNISMELFDDETPTSPIKQYLLLNGNIINDSDLDQSIHVRVPVKEWTRIRDLHEIYQDAVNIYNERIEAFPECK